MKEQLLATVIDDPDFTKRVSHVRLNAQENRLRCTCRTRQPTPYVSDVEAPSHERACVHIRMLYDPSLAFGSKINFTQEGHAEFAWRWAAKKLAASAQ